MSKDFSPSLIQELLKVFFPGKSEDAIQTNLTLLSSFARQGGVFLGLAIFGQEILDELFKGFGITVDQKKTFRKALNVYYDVVTELRRSEHVSLRQMEHENAKILNAKGEFSEENTLDSSIKRNTAVIKKLKQINEEQKETLMEELRSVNLSKFVNKFVMPSLRVQIYKLQFRYALCFIKGTKISHQSLVQGLLKVFFPGKSGDDLDADMNFEISSGIVLCRSYRGKWYFY
ncbi:hypothetical protein V6N13_069534 [Hibiscus sabdariffa]|uniref:Uncharacterized protein n=1 Tax=Hibiscus sabdariffa TaxID=183260 RepID=A0ABR2PGX1_9ROSI